MLLINEGDDDEEVGNDDVDEFGNEDGDDGHDERC